MKDDLQGKLVEILTSIQSAAGKASDFTLEQLPDIAQSYVAYGRATAILYIAVCLTVWVAAILCLRWALKNPWSDRYNDRAESYYAAVTVSSVVGFVAGVSLVIAVHKGALVWLAPKVWLLKEIATILK